LRYRKVSIKIVAEGGSAASPAFRPETLPVKMERKMLRFGQETAMNTLFGREVYIRLSEDGTHFVSTTRYGRFYTKTAEFALNCQPAPETVDEKSPVPARKRFSHWASEEQ
jgi:hypothetical protein